MMMAGVLLGIIMYLIIGLGNMTWAYVVEEREANWIQVILWPVDWILIIIAIPVIFGYLGMVFSALLFDFICDAVVFFSSLIFKKICKLDPRNIG